jgi:hypothetical protein
MILRRERLHFFDDPFGRWRRNRILQRRLTDFLQEILEPTWSQDHQQAFRPRSDVFEKTVTSATVKVPWLSSEETLNV